MNSTSPRAGGGGRELLVGKLLALLDRGSPRDAWHVAALPAPMRELLGQPRLRQLFLAMAATLDHPLPRYRHERLESALTGQAYVSSSPHAHRRSGSMRMSFRRAWRTVEPLVHLSPERPLFAALDEGELRLELLFPDEPAEAARLSAHPALQWKLSNLGQRPSRRSRS